MSYRSSSTSSNDSQCRPRRRIATQLVLLCSLAAISPLALCGCSGCRQEKSEAEKKKEKEQEEEREFSIGEMQTLSAGDLLNRSLVKPGHFVAASVPATSNKKDFHGDLETATVDSNRKPTVVVDTNFSVAISRPALLPKGQVKFLESTYYIPRDTGRGSKTIFLEHRLRAAESTRIVYETSHVTSRMPAHQYLLVVLATNPNSYGYLKQLHSVSPPFDEMYDSGEQLLYYQVVLPTIEGRAPVPSHSFGWTSIAYLVWDGIHPDLLTPDQQIALVDWLHWGGQLIVSGPTSLSLLQNSFLGPFLPKSETRSTELGPKAFVELNNNWSLVRRKTNERLDLQVVSDQPLLGVDLSAFPEDHFIPGTGRLVYETMVGRGRIAVTAFSLSSREIVNWGSFDNFFNACVLRKPPRQFTLRDQFAPQSDWFGIRAARNDPRLSTSTRYFSRDVAALSNGTAAADMALNEAVANNNIATAQLVNANELEQWHLSGYQHDTESGVGGWSDTSGAATAARRALRNAAGITIPKAGFVLRAMAIYLVFLVPLNWGFFRLIGRVEWAWFAVPILAIIGAIIVIKQAQLDIGFARSRTEISIMEIQQGTQRAHVTRYTALYNSLASSYTLLFDDQQAATRPMEGTSSPDRDWQMTFRRADGARLSPFQVVSSTTGFVHSEQMLDLQGRIGLQGSSPDNWTIANGTDLQFRHVGILHRTEAGRLLVSWAGDIPPHSTVKLTFRPSRNGTAWLQEWENPPAGTDNQEDASAVIDFKELLQLATQQLPIRPGDVRLIGWTDGELPGLTIEPEASQSLARTLVIAHLKYGVLPTPQPDENLLVDILAGRDLSNDTFNVLGEPSDNPDPAGTPAKRN